MMAFFLLLFFYIYTGTLFANMTKTASTLPEVSYPVLVFFWPYETLRHLGKWYGIDFITLRCFLKLTFTKKNA